jgi:hypothetical protein
VNVHEETNGNAHASVDGALREQAGVEKRKEGAETAKGQIGKIK